MKLLAYLFAVALGATTTAGPARAADDEPLEDLTPPVITVTPSAGAVDGWYADTASVFIRATDPGAIATGVRSVIYTLSGATTGSGSVHRTDGGTVTISNSGSTTIQIEATDGNDNQSFAAPVVRIDRTRPSAGFAGRMTDADPTFAQGEEVLLQFACADGQSGIGSCIATQPNDALLDTSTIGSHVVVITARDKVGHQTQTSREYRVVSNQFAVTRHVDMTGMEVVGNEMTVSEPVFSPQPTRIDYQWTRNGVPIPGATGTTYRLTPDDARTDLRVRATAVRPGWVVATSTSAPRRVLPAAINVTSEPVLTGDARFGGRLLVEHGTITPTAASISYQWLRDGALIPTATGRTYFPGPEDIGARISVRVAATAPGHAEAVWVTPETDVVRGRQLQVVGAPRVSGTMRAGSLLTAVPPTVSVPPVDRSDLPAATIAYQWLRNGVAIRGADRATYRLTASDVGRRVTVRTTATRPPHEGYEPVVQTSDPGPVVGKAAPQVTAKAKATKKRAVKLTITVSVPGVDPAAPVTVQRGGKVVARGKVTGSGRLVLSLKRQRKGKAAFTVSYAGSTAVEARTVRVSVTVR
jgi:hypothetical protein